MANDTVLEGRQIRLVLPKALKGFLMRAQVDEGLSQMTETVVEFMSPDLDLDLQKLVGERLRLEIDAPKDKIRCFQGHCVEATYLGSHQGRGYFRAILRPWLWFLTRTSDCRIFQDKSAIEVIKDIFGQHGFSDFKDSTKQTYQKRSYCVQYRETDFDFICRLMEEEGIYFFHTHDKTKETLVLVDEGSAHKAIEDHAEIEFHFGEEEYRRTADHVFEWRCGENIQSSKVVLQDYDFEKPKSDLQAVKALGRSPKAFEVYDYPGRYADTRTGEQHARVKLEGLASRAQRSRGLCNVRQMGAGGKFKLTKHPRKAENAEYLVISARHQLQIDAESQDREFLNAILGPMLDFDHANSRDSYRCAFEVQPINVPYRAPQRTPRPASPGLQTAVVVGKKGEEIWTDRYGRVKVQFHWDREGRRDENASCWVRTAVPWSGKNWGMVGVPRVGQEVVVQFEEGDPDRPLVTGMVYNGETALPYSLPAHQTQSGVKTQSSKGGGGFSELIFEDKKGGEFVRLQSERDFKQIIKNSAEIMVGLEHKGPGHFKQTIHGDKTERIVEGDHRFTVAKGAETIQVAQQRSTTIGDSDTLTVTKDHKVDVGATLEISAGSKITLVCGGSKIEMTPAKVTISATQIDVKANATASLTANGQLKMEGKGQAALKGAGMLKLEGGGMTEVKSSGLLIAKGSLTMIN